MITPDGEVPGDFVPFVEDEATMAAQFMNSSGLIDFAHTYPESEYRLWLLTRPENADLQKLSEQRTRGFERLPLFDKVQAAGAIAMGTAIDTVVVFAEAGLAAKLVIAGVNTSIFYNIAKDAIRNIPSSRTVAAMQRQLHESVFGVE